MLSNLRGEGGIADTEGWTGEERAVRAAFSKPISPLDVVTDHLENGRIFLDDGTLKCVPLEQASELWLQNKHVLFPELEAETAAFKRRQEAERHSDFLPGINKLPTILHRLSRKH